MDESKEVTLHLFLVGRWFREVLAGEKDVEYRAMADTWRKRIWEKRDSLRIVVFHCGYTRRTISRRILNIDIGPCPYPGWRGDFYRVHFVRIVPDSPAKAAVGEMTGG